MIRNNILIIFIALALVGVSVRQCRYNNYKKKQEKNIVRIFPPTPFIYSLKHADSSQHKYILISPYFINRWRYGRLIILDMKGNIVFQKNVDGAAFCFRQWNIDGHIRYTYLRNDPRVLHIEGISLAAGYIVVMDSALNEINQIHLVPNGEISLAMRQDLDVHDFILLSDNHYITMAVYEKTANNIPDSLHPSPKNKIASVLIQEVENGKVVWQWDATHFPELYGASNQYNNYSDSVTRQDYLHINSLFIDPKDSNLICSFRNTDQLLKLNRHNGGIVWRFGGNHSDFPLTGEQKFLRQHDAKLINNYKTLLLFDNGDSATRQVSRILEFDLDEKSKRVIDFRKFTIPETYSQYMGSVEKTDSGYMIGGGTAGYLLDVNTSTGIKNFEIQSNLALYRAYTAYDISGILNEVRRRKK